MSAMGPDYWPGAMTPMGPSYAPSINPASVPTSNYVGEKTGFPTIPNFSPYTQLGNMAPLQDLEKFAMGSGDSPWAQAQLDALRQATGQAQGNAASTANASMASAMDNAATHGGLTTGMLENLSRQGANNAAMARQNVWGQMLGQQGQIRSQDEQNRIAALENLPGQEVQALQPGLQEQAMVNQFNLGKYENQVKQQAGTEMANAQANSGKK